MCKNSFSERKGRSISSYYHNRFLNSPFIALTVSLTLTASAALYAADINYDGISPALQNAPGWFAYGSHPSLFPGTTASPLSSDNNVTVDYTPGPGLTDPENVSGGFSEWESSVNNNVTLINGNITTSGYSNSNIYGGYSYYRDAENNKVTVNGGSIKDNVYGGYSWEGNAIGNKVIVNGGAVGFNIDGGFSNSGDVTGNTVTVSSGSIGANVNGGYSDRGKSANNIVTVSGGNIGRNVYGGYCWDGDAINNTVNVSGGNIDGGITGGRSRDGYADGNMVNISGGRVSGDIYGGRSLHEKATGNTVTIGGAPDLTSSNIYGGFVTYTSGDAFSGNTLNFKSSGLSVAGVANFENYNFYLPAGTANGDIMLNSASAVDVGNTNVAIFLQGLIALQEGDRVTLIGAPGVTGTPNNSYSQAWLGSFVYYDFVISADAGSLWAELASISGSTGTLNAPVTKAITNSRLAPLAFINQGADLAAAIDDFVISGDKSGSRYTAFAAVNGGSSTYETGSDVDVDGVSLIAGVIWDAIGGGSQLLLSAFVEAGWGDYDTNNSFAGKPVRGGGDMDYYGGGLRARYQLNQGPQGGLYTDASLRVGKAGTDFSGRDALNSAGTKAGYDSDSTYYGAHLGLGYARQLNDKTGIDISSKFLWTRLDGDSFVSTAGDRIELDDADSRRWRTGFRVSHEQNERVSFYGGLAYEYEFDGDADGWLYGAYRLDRSSLSGGTGIGELGVRFKPSANNDRLTVSLGLQGYVGTRKGVSGGLKLLYTF